MTGVQTCALPIFFVFEWIRGRLGLIVLLSLRTTHRVVFRHLSRLSILGIRGIRLCFARPDLFIPQLRAIYRAASEGNIRIMFPMISTLEDVEQVREITEKVRKDFECASN